MTGTHSVILRLYVGGELVDEERVSELENSIEIIASRQGELAGQASARGQTYMVEVEFDDGEHVRWGTDPGGMVLPMAMAAEKILEYLTSYGNDGG